MRTSLIFSVAAAFGLWLGLLPHAVSAATPTTIRLDWATYNPSSLVMKQQGLLEREFKKDGVTIQWSQTTSGPAAIERIKSGGADWGSTAGSAALLGRLNGAPLKAVYVYARQESTALMAQKDSPIRSVSDLRGKRIAAMPNSDPYVFVLRALGKNGMTARDVTIVPMSHADGWVAFEKGEVDAWAGIDPMMAHSEIERGSRMFYRDLDMCTYGLLNVSESFLQQYPDTVGRVLTVYEKARKWAAQHPAEMKRYLIDAAKQPDAIIARQIERYDLSDPVLGPKQQRVLVASGIALKLAGALPDTVDVPKAVSELLDTRYSAAIAKNAYGIKPAAAKKKRSPKAASAQ